jgi:hypothetical protein
MGDADAAPGAAGDLAALRVSTVTVPPPTVPSPSSPMLTGSMSCPRVVL